MSCGVISRRGFTFFIRAYGMKCLIRFYSPDDDPEDLTAGYPLNTAKLVVNNLYICILEVFKQSMSQLIHKAKVYREQRYRDVPRNIHERTIINPDQTMTATLSSTDYFDALDRLPDPTYGETRHERLQLIVSMANSLATEDRVLVIYEPRIRAIPYGYSVPPIVFTTLTRYLIAPTPVIPIDYCFAFPS